MSVRHLEFLLKLTSVPLIGASNRSCSIGAVLLRNLLQGGLPGANHACQSEAPVRCGRAVLP